jgi:mono/diheme cytochrome c family protein/plastocyanin
VKNNRFIHWGLALLSLTVVLLTALYLRTPVTIHARVAEDGGFRPDFIQAKAGVPLHLRLVSDDVEHTFAIGQSPLDPIILKPGKPVEITLNFDTPGKYTFYSTTPSSLNFWRMRGVIEVTGSAPPAPVEPPLYVKLGLDLDQDHNLVDEHNEIYPSRLPSSREGIAFESLVPAQYFSYDYYLTHSPIKAFSELRVETTLTFLTGNELWNVVALIWEKNTLTVALAEGQRLYRVNCEACHGTLGAGDGQFADQMRAIADKNQDPHGFQTPTDFTNPEHLLQAKPVILQGKLLRGGMGTGMPMWGTIFTDQQLWNLVAYLYSFQFK